MSKANYQAEAHNMHLTQTHESGAEEWYCPTCGRRFLLSWPPNYKRTILEAGDEYAIHNGSKGGLQMGSVEVDQEDTLEMSDKLRDEIESILDDIDFDDWPDEPETN